MRLVSVLLAGALAALLIVPTALPSGAASSGPVSADATDLSAARKQKKQTKPAKPKEEYLKAAPSAPPPSGKSTY